MDKITIIAVCYDEAPASISYTIESALAQTYQNKEIIVIDGGSKTATIDCLNAYIAKGVKVISKPDNGIYHAMNRGIKAASGQWMLFMNMRDRFHSDTVLEDVGEYLNNEDGTDIFYGYIKTQYNKINKVKNLNKVSLYSRLVCHQAMFFSAESFQRVGSFDQSYRLQAYMDWLHRAVIMKLRTRYIPILICDWQDGIGASSDYKFVEKERIIVRKKYYSKPTIVLLSAVDLVERLVRRLISFNFSIPIALNKEIPSEK